jgi:hypothetical protein
MKKLIHILTIRDHRKMMVEPDAAWYKERWSGKYTERFGCGAQPGVPSKYDFFVYDSRVAHNDDAREVAYFNSMEAAEEWVAQENAKYPSPLEPGPPPPPLPIGTNYMLEARYYEIRQITRKTKAGVQTFLGNEWEQPYRLVSGWGTWQEKFIAKYDDRDQALAHLNRLIHK